MARNPFEQLQDMVVEPRQSFEEIATLILKCLNPTSRRIRVHQGDGGIDAYTGTLGDGGQTEVYQVKYFPGQWGDSQKSQIRSSYQTARTSSYYDLKKWILCVPTRLTKQDLRWFDEWRKQQDIPIELMDGDDLTSHLTNSNCSPARLLLKEWGIPLIQQDKPQFNVIAFLRKEIVEKSGRITIVILRLENSGERSGREIKVVVTHGETHCVANMEQEGWERASGDGLLNPRNLRYRYTLNPGEHSSILTIPLVPRSTFPFEISVKVTADDCRPTNLYCQLTKEQIEEGSPVNLTEHEPQNFSAIKIESPQKRPYPTSSEAKELLELIMSHELKEERGITEIISGSPRTSLDACFIPNTTASGRTGTMKKSQFRSVMAELIQLNWLYPPEDDGTVRIYELRAEE